MSKEQEKSENVVAMEVEESEEAKQERLQQEATALAIAGTYLPSDQNGKSTANTICLLDIKNNFAFLERAVDTIESRFTTRVLRTTTSIRKRLTPYILSQVINEYYGDGRLSSSNSISSIVKSLLMHRNCL
jgi:26S proteasome regulatory subunit N3